LTKRDRWILSEYLVACDRESRSNERLAAHRLRSPFAEIDLLFETRTPAGAQSFVIVEVKSVDRDLWGRPPLTRPQRLRLERARFWLESRAKVPVRLVLACVTADGRITYFDAPFA
jgi:Holliday junction resolvase-like predicted endonuclease